MKNKAPAFLKKKESRIIAWGDSHAPFHHPGTFDFLADLKREFKPTESICMGDELDYHAMSFHDTDPDGMSPTEEFYHGLKFMKEIYKIFPESKVCISNHSSLPFRRAFKFGLPSLFIRQYKEYMEAPDGWRWAERWEVDGVQYIHGTGFSGEYGHITAMKKHRQSTVIGHIHSHAGVQYSATERDLIFAVNTGWLGELDRYAFKYGRYFPNKPINGAAMIIDGKYAQFIPMDLGSRIKVVDTKGKIKDDPIKIDPTDRATVAKVRATDREDLKKMSRNEIRLDLQAIKSVVPVRYNYSSTKEELIRSYLTARKTILNRYR